MPLTTTPISSPFSQEKEAEPEPESLMTARVVGAVKKNLFFAVSENVDIDEQIKKTPVNENIEPLVGFRSMSSREANLDRINILISLMGEQNIDILRSIYNHFQPSDMFPVLPFPSKDPRHSDYLMLKYHDFFTEKQFTEPQNITYADEQNPFELYRIVSNMIQAHQATFKPISDHVCFGIALLTSKLLSLGALLIGLEYNKCVAIYNVSSTNYEIEDAGKFEQINQTSEPFLLWITGEAYNENRIPKKIRCTLRSFCTFVKNSNYGENKT